MRSPIDFYFDFSSPYGYLAAKRIDGIAAKHGRGVNWRPHLIGATFAVTGSRPLVNIPMKGDYAIIDIARTARLHGIPFNPPGNFPFLSVAAARAFYWLDDRDPAQARDLAEALYDAAFGAGGDITKTDRIVEIAGGLGVDGAELRAALGDPAIKARLKGEVAAAIERGVFGSPYIFVDGEPFWGHDKLADVERWLETGGW